jgi:hypothetical protein
MTPEKPAPPPEPPQQSPKEVAEGVREQRRHIEELDGEDPLRGGVAD